MDFIYDDADKHANEIAELYSYSEQSELHVNLTVSIGISMVILRKINTIEIYLFLGIWRTNGII